MNMFFYKDDFLSDADFIAMNDLVNKKYPIIEKEHKRFFIQGDDHPIRSRDDQFQAGITSLPLEGVVRYGQIAAKTVDQIYEFLLNDVKVINPEFSTLWFAYMTPERSLKYHNDGPVRGVPVEKCITTCLYLHDQWEEDWGGEIESEAGIKYTPKPNRLVIWSRDVIHRVSEITATDLPTKRMIMATTWTTEGQRNDF